jgi:hypothetical protein
MQILTLGGKTRLENLQIYTFRQSPKQNVDNQSHTRLKTAIESSWSHKSPHGVKKSPHGVIKSPHGVIKSPHGVIKSPNKLVELQTSPQHITWIASISTHN